MEKYLSGKSLKIYEVLNNKYNLNIPDELGYKITNDGTYLPKDFCICSLLNFYQEFENISKDKYNLLFQFAFWLEQFLGVHDGRKDKGSD